MIARSLSKTVVFNRPFLLKGVDRMLPAGAYRVVTDEELIEGLSFAVYRRVATMIFVPAPTHGASSIEMVTIDPGDLQAALERDPVAASVARGEWPGAEARPDARFASSASSAQNSEQKWRPVDVRQNST
jgi:hypothetical protein